MNNKNFISKDHFLKRIGDLCLRSGLSGFPKNDVDQHILLKSAVLFIEVSEALTEKEINEKLRNWCQITQINDIDHGTLRRRMVDTGYMTRSKDGSAYQICPTGTGKYEFEAGVDHVNIAEAIATAREEIERRKRLYAEKSKQA